MLRWILLILALGLALLGSLTMVKSPDWAPWKLAVLAGEYGHWVALAPLLVAALAWFTRGGAMALAGVTAVVCALAFGLLLRPTFDAWLLARTLPEKLERQFGRVELGRAPFSIGALFAGRPEPVRPETMKYSGELALDFFPPSARVTDGKRAAAPCVIVVHGGGWDGGDRTEIAHFDHWLLAAIAFLKTHAVALGFDATRLVLFGRSAGGNIAEATAYTAHDPAIHGVAAFYAPADLRFAYAYGREDDVIKSPQLLRQYLGGPPEAAGADYDGASGYLHVGKTTPPTLLVHGQLDPLTWDRQSVRLDARLAENGVAHSFVSLPWATHACEFNLAGPGGQLATFALEWFLAAVTK